ncbi:hypothetical protein E2C01_072959 [Portunus trituberculatus]|uniref:Uncharacterized protein n=1 Tax=Portunus trituberculatus TaxID=210409 RepID=A0A5B7I3Z0_PORTR|nr:hypothetical protein [Portunus trituberculatus]
MHKHCSTPFSPHVAAGVSRHTRHGDPALVAWGGREGREGGRDWAKLDELDAVNP